MARNDPTIYMRIPQELKDALDKASEESRRSLTAEVVARLQSTFSSLQGSMRGFEMSAQMDSAEDVAWTPQQVKLMKEVATEAAKQVVAFQAESLQPVRFGGGSVVQGPAPGDAAKPPAVEKTPAKKPT